MESNIVVMNVITEQTPKVFSKLTLNQNITEKNIIATIVITKQLIEVR